MSIEKIKIKSRKICRLENRKLKIKGNENQKKQISE